jgi:hypothetical protein
MVTESTKRNYRGVFCGRCRAPIPVSSKVVRQEDEIENEELNAPYTFPLRCRHCEQEGIYAMSDVQKFDGEPRARAVRSPTVGGSSFD